MRCDQFQDRLDLLLDRRADVRRDALLRDHAHKCPTCHDSLQIWCTIDEHISPAAEPDRDGASHPRPLPFSNTAIWAVACAAVLIVCVGLAGLWRSSSPSNDRLIASTNLGQPVDLGHGIDPADDKPADENVASTPDPLPPSAALSWQTSQWWSAMSDEPWVDHTLPAVNSVRIGVAPIGRSMKQAMAILMIQTQATTIDASSLAPSVQAKPFQEQTSTVAPETGLA
ncbi:hypothetical protein Mal15_66380 [Stieleria maiorica]|uniref:Zinc-finger domain-containing protein n=1 Tax=Stieleria maiorica TaxID=2795974 RepID=A0A5B9MR48_9BACT|nr:hypothetical protein [Stieleria maiorica]QEG02517.1 hypothetical protein Mal15_66380 [Stieleria maiorica]